MTMPFARLIKPMVLAIFTAMLSFYSSAAPLAEFEVDKVRGVIVAQLAAFADDDADGAFETATPAVQEAIGNSGLFLAMVRGAYPLVYRTNLVHFHKVEEDKGSVLQLVEILDDNAKSWLALFALEQQADSTWRISGCIVVENQWKSV